MLQKIFFQKNHLRKNILAQKVSQKKHVFLKVDITNITKKLFDFNDIDVFFTK
ncbi:hypothetical protein WZ211_1071 [Enterococcus faecalis]|nr:hypothetical protein HMPREF9500_01318 [Enterococcus faecalis TX0017]EPH83708.1 hypothetical protein D927_00781 [Enterococcus faecalis 02-MB-BW-10]OSH33039.1 hypothetical protein WZ211_1071 [Enterococcus faecalis]OSH46461.1 hypothetical protein YM392_0946 [Enterococcus faecalis]